MLGIRAQLKLLKHGRVALKKLGGGVARHDVVRHGGLFHQVLDSVQRLMRRAAANIQLVGQLLALGHLHGAAHQFVKPLALARANGDYRHAQALFQPLDIDCVAVAARLVHHVKGHHHRTAQLQKLQGQVEVALQIGCVHDVDDHIGLVAHNIVAAYNLLQRIGAKGVDAGQIDDGNVRILLGHAAGFAFFALAAPGKADVGLRAMVMVQHSARFLLHRYAGPVAHMLVAAR